METEEAWRKLVAIAQSPEEEINLDRAALVLAATEYPELDIAQEIAALDSLAAGAARRLGDQRDLFEDRPPVSPGVPGFLGGEEIEIEPLELPPMAYYPGLKLFVQEAETEQRRAVLPTAEAAVTTARQAIAELESKQATARAEQAEAEEVLASLLSEGGTPEETPAAIPPNATRASATVVPSRRTANAPQTAEMSCSFLLDIL